MINFLIATAFLMSSVNKNQLDIIPSGENIVFEIKPEGIIITGFYKVKIDSYSYDPLKDSDIRIGDIILEVNNTKISSIEEFLDAINQNQETYSVNLLIKRNQSKITKKLNIKKLDNIPKTGLFVKERVLGVGTLTFIDTENNIYGALGHEVIDNSTNQIIDVDSGYIYKENVINISKGSNGNPGEKQSTTNLSVKLGDIEANTEYGIFGNLDSSKNSSYVTSIANRNEVKLGKATILTCIEGNKVEEFEIEITSLKKQELKGITFKITDERLLKKAGGVYSGMSGSPIIQNGKLVGAVTHVIVNNISTGYGIYIEDMYEECLENCRK